MLGMFNTGATTRHREMVGFNRGINLVESYPLSLPFLVCHVLSEKFFRDGETLIAFLYVTLLRLMRRNRRDFYASHEFKILSLFAGKKFAMHHPTIVNTARRDNERAFCFIVLFYTRNDKFLR